MNYWINSNSGDYITENNGQYTLTLLPRFDEAGKYMSWENVTITPTQFNSLKGFIPIKEKKLFNNRQRKTYGPTLSDGSKGRPKRVELPTKAETRDEILKSLGL